MIKKQKETFFCIVSTVLFSSDFYVFCFSTLVSMTIICQSCTLKINGNQCRLTCCFCERVYHASCCNVSSADAQYMTEHSVSWKCSQCLESMRGRAEKPLPIPSDSKCDSQPLTIGHFNQLMAAIASLQNDSRDTAARFDALKTAVDSVNVKLDETRNSLEASIAVARAEIDSLKIKNTDLESQLQSLRVKTGGDAAFADVVREVSDQHGRQGNLIIFNLAESRSDDSDELRVRELLRLMNGSVSLEGVKILRLGRIRNSGGQPRPIKVIFPVKEAVGKLLKNAVVLRNSSKYVGVSVSRDRTPHQLSLFRAAKAELQDRQARGETELRIKYVRGSPVVVSSMENASTSGQRNF